MFSRRELLGQALRAYCPRFLRTLVTGEAFFPLALRIGKTHRADDYHERQADLAGFRAATGALGLTVDWREVNDPRFGRHDRPESAAFVGEAAFLAALGKTNEVRAFRDDLAQIRAALPEADRWIAADPRRVVEHHGDWPRLLRVVRWFQDHPRSGLYLRQLPVEGVDTKFFERRFGILDALLLHAQPSAVDTTAADFRARHGLRWEAPLIRFRFLDDALRAAHDFPVADLAVPAPVFRGLTLPTVTAVVTENLRNFLALPLLPGAVAIFGNGDAAGLLAGADWLTRSRLLYWGDLDAKGFIILSRLRAAYPHAESLLMDGLTLAAHQSLAVPCEHGSREPTPNLNPSEARTFAEVCVGNLRLEQERLPFAAVEAALRRAFSFDENNESLRFV